MQNITINIPELYDENIQKLIKNKIVPSRSAAIRTAIRDFLQNSYFTPDPWFKRIYYNINELVKEGKSKKEILRMKF